MWEQASAEEPELFSAVSRATSRQSAELLVEMLQAIEPPPLADVVERMSGAGDEWEAGAYFRQPPDPLALDLLAASTGCGPFRISPVRNRNWLACNRSDLAPVEAGRFWIHGSHETQSCPSGKRPIKVDAALAFGTGRHGTTQGCIRLLERLSGRGVLVRNVCDIGCGTGILAIASAMLWPCQVVAGDNDPDAVDQAVRNATDNGVDDQVRVVGCGGFEDPAFARLSHCDLVTANILSGPLKGLAREFALYCRAGGYLVVSGLLAEEEGEMLDALCPCGFEAEDRIQIDEWLSLLLVRTG